MNGTTNYRELLIPGHGALGSTETICYSVLGSRADLVIELHYGDFGTGAGREAALCLVRKRDKSHSTPVYVPLSCLWMYVQGKKGEFNDSFAVMIPELCKRLYGQVTKSDAVRVMDAIIDFLDDLRKSPPDTEVFADEGLKSFLQELDDNDLEFWVEVDGKRTTLN